MFFRRARSPRERIVDAADPVGAALFDDVPCGVAAIDDDGLVLRANAPMALLAGAAERVGAGAPLLALFAADMRETVQAALRRVRGGGPAETLVARLPAGTARLTLHAAAARPGATPDFVLLRAVDISQLLLLERQVAVSQRMQEVGLLTGGVAHDFNNLLTALIGAAEAIVARPGIDRDTLEDAQQIRDSARRGADLVAQLQAFGRQQTLQPQVLPVNPALTALADMLRRLLGGAIRLQLELESPGRSISIDPTQFDRALMNLAMNARQAMEDGGVLTLRSRHATLLRPLPGLPDTVPPGRYVTLDVEDTGPGIAPDLLERIFEPFFTTRRDAGGNGLGLATVHGIVRQSGGYLTVDSALGRGTCMRVHLPRWDGALAAIPPAPAQHAAQPGAAPVAGSAAAPVRGGGAARVVLLVEDEPAVLRLAERALQRAGWQVLTAPDGEHALAIAAGPVRIDAAVTDMMMPGMDGARLLRQLRRLPGLSSLPAILVSGYAEASLRDEAAIAATLFLAKPYGMKELAARLDALVAMPAEAAEPAG